MVRITDKNENEPDKKEGRDTRGKEVEMKERNGWRSWLIRVVVVLVAVALVLYVWILQMRMMELEMKIRSSEGDKSKIDTYFEQKSNEIKLKEDHSKFVEEMKKQHYSESYKYREQILTLNVTLTSLENQMKAKTNEFNKEIRLLKNEKQEINDKYNQLKISNEQLEEKLKKLYEEFQESLKANQNKRCDIFEDFDRIFKNQLRLFRF